VEVIVVDRLARPADDQYVLAGEPSLAAWLCVRQQRGGAVSSGYPRMEASVRWQDYISVDPSICHGQACVRGTRVPVAVILANLAAGVAREELLRSYPGLTPEAVQASLAYAAELAQERVVALPA
jgi:uncharacterized protein (DUF433 family)